MIDQLFQVLMPTGSFQRRCSMCLCQKYRELKEDGRRACVCTQCWWSLQAVQEPHALPAGDRVSSAPCRGGDWQSSFCKELRYLTNESTKFTFSHLQVTSINGTNIWQVTLCRGLLAWPPKYPKGLPTQVQAAVRKEEMQ